MNTTLPKIKQCRGCKESFTWWLMCQGYCEKCWDLCDQCFGTKEVQCEDCGGEGSRDYEEVVVPGGDSNEAYLSGEHRSCEDCSGDGYKNCIEEECQ